MKILKKEFKEMLTEEIKKTLDEQELDERFFGFGKKKEPLSRRNKPPITLEKT